MINYNVTPTVFTLLTPERSLGTSSYDALSSRSDDPMWSASGNFSGMGSIVYQREGRTGIITHFLTTHSGNLEHTVQLTADTMPSLTVADNRLDLTLGGEFVHDSIHYKTGIQYLDFDGSPIELILEGAHSLIVHGILPEFGTYEGFKELLEKYAKFVSEVYNKGRTPKDPEDVQLEFEITPNPKCTPSLLEFIMEYEDRQNTIGFQTYGDSKGAHRVHKSFVRGLMYAGASASGDDFRLDQTLWRPATHDWGDILCIDDPVDEMWGCIDAFLNPEGYRDRGHNPLLATKIIINGSRGLGKSMLAHVAVRHLLRELGDGCEAYRITYGDMSDKYRGQEARNTRVFGKQIQATAESGKSVIVAFEEIQSIGIRRQNIHFNPNEFLDEFIDVVERCHEWGNVFLIATTAAYYGLLDDQLTREGRFSTTIEIPMPNKRQRQEFLKARVEQLKDRAKIDPGYADNLNYGKIAKATDGFPFAELNKILREPSMWQVKEHNLRGIEFDCITTEQIIKYAKKRKSQLDRQKKFQAVLDGFGYTPINTKE